MAQQIQGTHRHAERVSACLSNMSARMLVPRSNFFFFLSTLMAYCSIEHVLWESIRADIVWRCVCVCARSRHSRRSVALTLPYFLNPEP